MRRASLKRIRVPWKFSAIVLAVFGLMVSISAVANTGGRPEFQPRVLVNQTNTPISIDGDLNDPGWVQSRLIDNFVESYPGDNTMPEVGTRAYLSYDKDRLYVAFVCLDDPTAIRATMCQRDQFYSDDEIGIVLDTYGEASWAYGLYINPYGVQKDYLWSNVGGQDYGFDLIWQSAAKVTDSGYQVEMAIPFSSLRFPDREQQSWRLNVYRNRPRDASLQYSWAAIDRNESCWPCQFGTVEGIQEVHPGHGFEILPSYVGNQASTLENRSDRDDLKLVDGEVEHEFSLGAKYSISSDITAEGYYNPDFSQIEADAAQVDVNSTISLFFPERRPFFQEGSDVFRTLFNSFYTRTVNDPLYATKVVSRKSKLTVGFMSAFDENSPYIIPLDESSELYNAGESYVNVLRSSYSVGHGSEAGLLVADRRYEHGGYNTVLAADGDIRLSQVMSIDGQFVLTWTGEPDKMTDSRLAGDLGAMKIVDGQYTAVTDGESYYGTALISRLKRFARNWSFMLDFNQVEPGYRTEVGYDPTVNYRNLSMWNRYRFYYDDGLIQRLDIESYVQGRWRFDGVNRWENQNLTATAHLNWAQSQIQANIYRGSEAWSSYVTGDLIRYHALGGGGVSLNSRFNSMIATSLSLNMSRGVALYAQAIGNESQMQFSLSIKPIDRLTISPSVTHVRSTHVDERTELYRQFITRTRCQLQILKELSIRLVFQYNDSKGKYYLGDTPDGERAYFDYGGKSWDIDPLITYRISPFSVLYAGSTNKYSYFDQQESTANPGYVHPEKWELDTRQFFVKLQYLFQM